VSSEPSGYRLSGLGIPPTCPVKENATRRVLRFGRCEKKAPHPGHAAASFAIAAGASVKGVQSMLGHRSATLSLDRYASLWPDELDAVADRIDAAMKSKIPRTKRGLNPQKLRAVEAG